MPSLRPPMESHSLAFRGERLQLVREFRGFTQKQMAQLLRVSNVAISEYENGKRFPPMTLVSRVAFEMGFLPAFFFSRIEDPFLEAECSFRHRRTTAQRAKDQVRAHASLLGMTVAALTEIFRFPRLTLPTLPAVTDDEIEQAAEQTRLLWQLDLRAPVRQITRALERAGIMIIAGSVDTTKIDAFSRVGTTPMIFLNTGAGTFPSRWNFDLAHELGHLVMHHGLITGSAETEMAADKFASAFLLPRRSFQSEFRSKPFSWSLVFELKRRWQVSAAAIVRRGRDLGLLNELTYRRAFQYMSAKRWRVTGEPYEPTFQQPELFAEAIESLRGGDGSELTDICDKLGFTPEAFARITGVATRPFGPSRVLSFPTSDV